ncbi:MAG: Ig-like domain-containing protein [Acidobacteriota bacterium]
MRSRLFFRLSFALFVWLLIYLSLPLPVSLNTFGNGSGELPLLTPPTSTETSSANFVIKQRNPVVNEGNHIKLSAIDLNGQPAEGVGWESGSPDIARVNPRTGEVEGVKKGFATITARRGNESVSVFVVVAKIGRGKGAKVPGDTKIDGRGALYISNPDKHVILRADKALTSEIKPFAGQEKIAGNRNGSLTEALFAGPTAIAIDNGPRGGIYITDTLNHSIRRIDFNNRVETVLGTGSPGTSPFDSDGSASFGRMLLSSPRGIGVDTGGNLYIADTDNHAIYYVDFARREVLLLAGAPGIRGKEDGHGQQARFNRPSGMALSSDGRILTVADQDNNRVRIIEIVRKNNGQLAANVSTLGVASSARGVTMAQLWAADEKADEIVFDKPQSVSLDGIGNIYVVDRDGVQVVTRPTNQMPQVIQLAQPNVSFNKAVSVIVRGREVFVLDENEQLETEAVKVVTVGGPEVMEVVPNTLPLNREVEVIVKGKNFAPESVVTFGDRIVENAKILSATEIRFQITAQNAPGVRTLTVLTRGGIAQRELDILAKPASELAVGGITTIVGGLSFFGDGGIATKGSLFHPIRTAVDSNGNLFIADISAQRIRRVDAATGIITTVAGGGSSLKDGELANLAMVTPAGIALDGAGNIFIADMYTSTVRCVDALTGRITTVAGVESRYFGGDGGPATKAGLGRITDIAVDGTGNLYILGEDRLRRVDAKTGIITTIAGDGQRKFKGDNGPATEASFRYARTMALDAAGNIFIGDLLNLRVRRVDATTGIITTVAGNGKYAGPSGSIDISKRDGKLATNASLGYVSGLAIDKDDSLLIFDGSLSRVDAKTGLIRTLPIKDPHRPEDKLVVLGGLALDGVGNLFITTYHSVRRMDAQRGGTATLVAGSELVSFRGDDLPAAKTSLADVKKIVRDGSGNLYFSDLINGLIRKLDIRTGRVKIVAGRGSSIHPFFQDDIPATEVVLFPVSFDVDKVGNLYIFDLWSNRIRRVDATTGIITTIAGNGDKILTNDGRPALTAGLGSLNDIAVDADNNLYLLYPNRIRRVDVHTGIINTMAGGTGVAQQDGVLAIDSWLSTNNILIDGGSNLLIVDNNRVRRIDTRTNIISTIAGNGKTKFSGEGGPAKKAGLGYVTSMAQDSKGNIYIGSYEFVTNERGILRILRVDAGTGIITTVIRSDYGDYTGDGGPAANAKLTGIESIGIDQNDNLLINSRSVGFASIRLVKLFGESNHGE